MYSFSLATMKKVLIYCWLLCLGSAIQAIAQTGPYQSTTQGAIGAGTVCGVSDLVATISVPDNVIIADLDVGFLASHTWRTDINFTLTSPLGTSSALLTGPYAISVNNYNIRLDDEAAGLVDQPTHNSSDTIAAAPPYQNTVRPESVLSVFDGENANGVWTLLICDVFSASDNGQFLQADLFVTPEPAALSASKSVSVWDPNNVPLYALPGNDVIYSISITNSGNGYADAGSLFLVDSIPPDMVFYNGDIDDAGPETDPVSFTDNGSGLGFTGAGIIAYSNSATKPTDFVQCTYIPASGYDPLVQHICIEPGGQMQPGTPDPNFTVNFRARIK